MTTFSKIEEYVLSKLPEYVNKNSAAINFFAAEDILIPSIWSLSFKGMLPALKVDKTSIPEPTCMPDINPVVIHTGISVELDSDEIIYLFNRNSNPMNNGLVLANGIEVIDVSSEITFSFYNFKPYDVKIKAGECIGRGILQKVIRPKLNNDSPIISMCAEFKSAALKDYKEVDF